MPKIRKHVYTSFPLFLFIIASIYFSYLATGVSSWGIDESVTFRQILTFISEGSFPYFGLFNSKCFRNPNGLPLILAPIVLLRQPFAISFALSLAQTTIVFYAFYKLLKLFNLKLEVFCLYTFVPLFLLPPAFYFFSTELWAQYIDKTLVLLLVGMLIEAWLRDKPDAYIKDFIIGCLILLIPSIHLAAIIIVPFAAGLVFVLYRRGKINVPALTIGGVMVILASWLPWYYLYGADAMLEIFFATLPSSPTTASAPSCLDYMWNLLTDMNDGGGKKVAFAAMRQPTEIWANLFNTIRLTLAGIILLFLLGKARISKTKKCRVLLCSIALVAAFPILMSLGGYFIRSDYFLLFMPSFYMLVAVSGCFLHKSWMNHEITKGRKVGRKIALTLGVLLMITSFGLEATVIHFVYQDNLVLHSFWGDIPLKEKLAAMSELSKICESEQNKNPLAVKVKIKDFVDYFGWCYYFNNKDIQGFYRPDIFYDTFARYCAGKNDGYYFIPYDSKEEPNYILTYPPSDTKLQLRKENGRQVVYERLCVWPSLALWKRTPLENDK